MLVAVFGDAHAHAEALEAVIDAADISGAREYWSLGDMIGGGLDPERAVALTREGCTVALGGTTITGRPVRWTRCDSGSRTPRRTARSS